MASKPQEPEIHPADRYTPAKVERILRQFPYMLDRHTYEDVKAPPAKRLSANDWLESRMAERADVEWALNQLPPFQYRVVYLVVVGGKSLREVASIVGKSHVTVRQNRIDGINYMAWLLGWRDAEAGWG